MPKINEEVQNSVGESVSNEQADVEKIENNNFSKEEQVENIDIKQSSNTITSNLNRKSKYFDIVYGCIILVNALCWLTALVFISLSRKKPLDVYFTMPIQYLSVLVLSIAIIFIEIMTITKLFKGKLTYKYNSLSFIVYLVNFVVSIFVLFDTIISLIYSDYWQRCFSWLAFAFSVASIILSIICILYFLHKTKRECWKNNKIFNSLGYLFTVIICACSVALQFCWFDTETVFINKVNNELTEVFFFEEKVEQFTIPDGVTSIGKYAFCWNNNLKSIEIPDSVTTIGDGAFSYFDSLEEIIIPNSIKSVDISAFRNCNSLKKIYYNGTIEDWCSIKFGINYGYYYQDSNPMHYAEHLYMLNENGEYYEVTELVIPDTVTNIGSYQFVLFENIIRIVIPNSVTNIEEYAFIGPYDYYWYGKIYCEATSKPSGWDEDWCLLDSSHIVFGYKADLNE